MSKMEKDYEVVQEMEKYQIKIFGVSEIKKVGNGIMQIAGKHNMYDLWVEAEHRAKEGVRIIVKTEVDSRITEFKPLSAKIMYLKLKIVEVIYIKLIILIYEAFFYIINYIRI